jgi:voltage-gated potassium channel
MSAAGPLPLHTRLGALRARWAVDLAPSRHLLTGALLLLGLTIGGTLGFAAIAHLSWIDALYMAVTTLSTVGYGEVQPLDAQGRLFASAFIAVGVGAALYTAAALAEFLIAGELRELLGRRTLSRTLESMRDHVILCGYGRLGRALAEELGRAGVPHVVIDDDPAATAQAEARQLCAITASAADDGVLERAGIARARALVAATGSEPVNVYVSLAARDANPAIAIHARADTPAGARRLQQAGASQVVSPHVLGGQRMAHAIVRPAVVDFLELTSPGSGSEIDLEEVALATGSPLAGLALDALADRGVRVAVVALRRAGAPLLLNPAAAETLRSGDRVVVVGDRASVNQLAALAAGTPRATGRGGSSTHGAPHGSAGPDLPP